MTKAELTKQVSEATGVDQVDALPVIEKTLAIIQAAVAGGETVFLRGFGAFVPALRKEKTGRNIKAETTIIIPQHYAPSFKPYAHFKNIVKSRKVRPVPSVKADDIDW